MKPRLFQYRVEKRGTVKRGGEKKKLWRVRSALIAHVGTSLTAAGEVLIDNVDRRKRETKHCFSGDYRAPLARA